MTLGLLLVTVSVSGWAAAPAQAANILIVRSADDTPYREAETRAQERLNELGHATRVMPLDQVSQAASNPPWSWCDSVLAIGGQSAYWLRQHLPESVNLTYCMVSDPSALKLDQGRTAWGITTNIPIKQQLALMADALPDTRVVGLLYDSSSRSATLPDEMRANLPRGWRCEAVDIADYGSPSVAINALLDRQIDVVWTAPDSSIYQSATVRQLLLEALRQKTPVFGFSPAFVRAGALLGTGIDPAGQGEQIADLLHEWLGGMGDMPRHVQRSPQFRVAVNLIVADKLDVELAPRVVRDAAYVFDYNSEAKR